jgi:hypothetical protein
MFESKHLKLHVKHLMFESKHLKLHIKHSMFETKLCKNHLKDSKFRPIISVKSYKTAKKALNYAIIDVKAKSCMAFN